MKKLYFLFFLTIGFLSNAQIINFPDTKFKAKLLSASSSNTIASTNSPIYNSVSNSWSAPNYQKIDINNDGEIEVSEALQVKYLDISNTTSLPASFQISSVSGIEEFTNLEALKCVSNQVSSINILGLTNLKLLDFYYNRLTEFNIQGLTNLRQIHCGRNQITSLNVQGLINLTQIRCFQNQITSLNVEGLINLKELSCASNQITSINLQNLNSLNSLYCESNLLSTLDLSNAPNLLILNCQNNLLTSLFIKNGKTEVLNFSNNISLQYICCDEIQEQDIENAVITNGQNCNVNSYCSFVPGGVYYEIVGSTKFDFNNNGCDISDIDYSNLNLIISNGTNSGGFIASTFGSYLIPVQAGIHTITPNLENPTYFNISPTSFTANFPTQASPFTQDFCVTANGVKSDVEVMVMPTTPARPGFDAKYKIVYNNKGNQIENGTVVFTFLNQDALDIVLSNPIYNSDNNDGFERSFSWNYSNLQPFESREIEVVLNLNSPIETPALNGGDLLNLNANITPLISDEYINDNEMSLRQIIVNSYDPNDKTCLQGTTITQSEVGKYVHYVIRFENTGTFPAENIVVKDMIDLTKFDITTLVPLKSSHDFFTRISGNKVEFIFENINLDFNDATNDGYVVFKIKTLPTLVLGDTFTNNANIYFDYNFPITTNTYTTTVAALSTQDFDFGTYFTLYPNPAKDVLNIQTKQSLAINSVEIYNQLGQIVMATTNAINSVDVANLASGTYFVKVNTEKGSANAKFVKE
jgi:hypothetical protein